jgi:hypothetical protein
MKPGDGGRCYPLQSTDPSTPSAHEQGTRPVRDLCLYLMCSIAQRSSVHLCRLSCLNLLWPYFLEENGCTANEGGFLFCWLVVRDMDELQVIVISQFLSTEVKCEWSWIMNSHYPYLTKLKSDTKIQQVKFFIL